MRDTIAYKFASEKHRGQERNGGEPYINHPERVAKTVEKFKKSKNIDALITAALLHDTVEDTDTTLEDLVNEFCGMVSSIVDELTSDKEEIAKIGKAVYLAKKMAVMSSYALVIKLADRLDNIQDIATAKTPEWRKKYRDDTLYIIEYIENNRVLSATHCKIIEAIKDKLSEIND